MMFSFVVLLIALKLIAGQQINLPPFDRECQGSVSVSEITFICDVGTNRFIPTLNLIIFQNYVSSIIQQYPNKSNSITIEGKRIYKLDSSIFPDLDLDSLSFDNNQLMNVSDRALSLIRSLKDLRIKQNLITHIDFLCVSWKDSAAANMWQSNLNSLDLRENYIDTIRANSFSCLTSMSFIDLSRNRIKKLPFGLFRSNAMLRKLNINVNNLQEDLRFDETSQMLLDESSQLNSLTLYHNNVTRIYRTTFKCGLRGVTRLYLSYNNIESIEPYSFANLALLNSLMINHNRIKVIESFAFYGLENVVILDMRNNSITQFRSNIGPNNLKMRTFRMDVNQDSVSFDKHAFNNSAPIIHFTFKSLDSIKIESKAEANALNDFLRSVDEVKSFLHHFRAILAGSGKKLRTIGQVTFFQMIGIRVELTNKQIEYFSHLNMLRDSQQSIFDNPFTNEENCKLIIYFIGKNIHFHLLNDLDFRRFLKVCATLSIN